MCKLILVSTIALALSLTAGIARSEAAPVPIHMKNMSQSAIEVVMDTEREVHRIAPGGAETFHPNIGDNPTYHVYEVVDGKRGRKLCSESFNTVWVGGGFIPLPHVGGDLKWTGGRLKRD